MQKQSYHYWQACVGRGTGPGESKCFSVIKHGDVEACRLACEWRARQLEERGVYMNPPEVQVFDVAKQYNSAGEVAHVPFYGEPSVVV